MQNNGTICMCLRLLACVCVCRQKSFWNLLEGNEGAPKKLTTTATDTHSHTHTHTSTDWHKRKHRLSHTPTHTYTDTHTAGGDARLSHVLHIFRHLSYFHEMCTTTHNRQTHTTHQAHTGTHLQTLAHTRHTADYPALAHPLPPTNEKSTRYWF